MLVASMSQLMKHVEGRLHYRCGHCLCLCRCVWVVLWVVGCGSRCRLWVVGCGLRCGLCDCGLVVCRGLRVAFGVALLWVAGCSGCGLWVALCDTVVSRHVKHRPEAWAPHPHPSPHLSVGRFGLPPTI